MNGRVAKKLRRQAEGMSVGQPAKEYELIAGKRYRDKNGYGHQTNTLVLTASCTRSIYQNLKKGS